MAVWQCHKKAVRCDTNCEETSRMKVLSAPLVLVAAGLLASLMPCSASADDPLQRGTWLVSLEAFYSTRFDIALPVHSSSTSHAGGCTASSMCASLLPKLMLPSFHCLHLSACCRRALPVRCHVLETHGRPQFQHNRDHRRECLASRLLVNVFHSGYAKSWHYISIEFSLSDPRESKPLRVPDSA